MLTGLLTRSFKTFYLNKGKGEVDFENAGEFERGIYTVTAFYEFTTGEDGERVSGSFIIPVTIE